MAETGKEPVAQPTAVKVTDEKTIHEIEKLEQVKNILFIKKNRPLRSVV